jgi:hypothetical protein
LRRIDLHQELALLHPVPFAHRDLDDAARDVRAHIDPGVGLDLPARRDNGDQVAIRYRFEADIGRAIAAARR